MRSTGGYESIDVSLPRTWSTWIVPDETASGPVRIHMDLLSGIIRVETIER